MNVCTWACVWFPGYCVGQTHDVSKLVSWNSKMFTSDNISVNTKWFQLCCFQPRYSWNHTHRLCTSIFFSHVWFWWTTGFITTTSPEHRSLWKGTTWSASFASNTHLAPTIIFHFSSFCWPVPSVFSVGTKESGDPVSFSLLPKQLCKCWFFYKLLHRTTSLCRCACAFKCEEDTWCARSLTSFVEG